MTARHTAPTGAPSPQLAVSTPAVLGHLRARTGLELWVVGRVTGDRVVVVDALDHGGIGLRPEARLHRSESLCTRMLAGTGPHCAPDLAREPAYAATPLARHLGLRAYLGAPIRLPDGALFGTLWGADRQPQPDALTEAVPEVELLARLLGVIAGNERRAAQAARAAERAGVESSGDPLTGVADRRAWQRALHAEDDRCRRSGTPASVAVVKLDKGDPGGDGLRRRAAAGLSADAGREGLVARLGEDAFGVLALDREPRALARSLQATLTAAGLGGAVGAAERLPGTGLVQAWRSAGAASREASRGRRPGRGLARAEGRREAWSARI